MGARSGSVVDMKVDAALPPGSLSQVAERARWASLIGFDGVVTVETSHDPFLALAVATTTAPDLDLETGIAVAFPRSPTITAHIAWDLAQASGGRFTWDWGLRFGPTSPVASAEPGSLRCHG